MEQLKNPNPSPIEFHVKNQHVCCPHSDTQDAQSGTFTVKWAFHSYTVLPEIKKHPGIYFAVYQV